MKTSLRPASLSQRLNGFAIATILAVGLLAVAWPAEAEIVYTPTNITIEPNSECGSSYCNASYNLDLNNDGVIDFTISASRQPSGGFIYDCGALPTLVPLFTFSVSEMPASGNGAEGSPPAALSGGDQIGPSQTFYAGQGTLRSDSQSRPHTRCGPVINNYSGDWTPGFH